MPRRVGDKTIGIASKKKQSGVPKKKRRRKNSWDYEDDDGDVEFEAQEDSGSESEEKPKKKRIQRRNIQEEKKKTVDPVRRKKTTVKDMMQDEQEDEDDRSLLEEKHRNRMQQYEQDSEQLLQEVRELALQEKRTQEKLIEKLKRDITTLSKQAEDARKKRTKEVDRLVADKMREYEAEQRKKDDRDVEKKALRERIKELESQFASFKRSTGPDDVVTINAAASAASAMQNSEAIIQLDQANKLLELYRLVTSTNIRLIQATDDDEQDSDDCVEIVCTTTDSATGNQFEFELAVSAIVSSEIEYLPSEKPPMGVQVPSYLREELSFSRSEVTKFFRSVLDVVIRKKKS
ncbi:unnamed protein product [Peronospora belbahrii]|uniref:Monopolin complex subunit Csm1/Pcs1 C-terminal domain-containing protein n=1 Tax=Peronospora belbahrii TaxID=622444 RepID=A0AAU9L440_9STRA|nr:unnamed protein product [Peronospora belbahrii]